jgi:hypothetical protein
VHLKRHWNRDSILRAALTVCLMAVISGSTLLPAIGANPKTRTCLNAINRSGRPVLHCIPSDSANIRQHRLILKAASALEIDIEDITFNGCPGGDYKIAEDRRPDSLKYIIWYPSENGLAEIGPLIHELAHVHQLKAAGGMRQLDHSSPRKIELAADFIAGLVFKKALEDVRPGDYETGLSLMGLYFEEGPDPHGSPEDRTAAFRIGYYFNFTEDIPDINAAHQYFYEDIYGSL